MLNNGRRDYLLRRCELLSDQLVASGVLGIAQSVIAGQRRLAVQIQQQNAKASIGEHTAQVGGDGSFTRAALGRDQREDVHGQSPVDSRS
ncbi:hypothetical protein D3C81_1493050 [compost metagenome]